MGCLTGLSLGPSVILAFIGGKLIVTFLHQLDPAIPHVPIAMSPTVIVAVLAVTTVASVLAARRDPSRRAQAGSVWATSRTGLPKPPTSPAGRSAPRSLGRITRTGHLTRSDWHIHQERLRDRPPGPHSCSRCARRSFPAGVAPWPSGRRSRLRNQASGPPAAGVAGLDGSDGSGEAAASAGAASEGVAVARDGRLLACTVDRVCSSRTCQSSSLLVRYHRPQVTHFTGMAASSPGTRASVVRACRFARGCRSGATHRQGGDRPIRRLLLAIGRQPACRRTITGHSIGSIGVAGQSSSRAPSTAASRVNRWAGSVAA
jgi:hypothetical protein